MITVTFMNGIEHITCDEHLYQWDKGQSITIKGIVAEGTPAIHFCNKKSERAIVVTPTNSGGVYTGTIPNSLLREPYPIIAYLYAYDDTIGKTIKTIEIQVENRVQPDDYIFEGDEPLLTLAEINSRVDAFLLNTKAELDDYVNNLVTDTGLSNADTLDGKHADEFALKSEIPTTLPANGGHADTANSANTATSANTANSAANATNAENVCGFKFAVGTDEPTTTNCPVGTWYGQYE